jgi:hypothetical protein
MGELDEDIPAEISFLHEEMNSDPECLGHIVPIPDKGKFRNILVGHSAIQLKTKKLADWLRSWLWSQQEIASGDQSKMSRFILSNLKLGKVMISIDLSEATDRLSVDLQIKLLISMGVPKSYFDFMKLHSYFNPSAYGLGPKRGRYSKIKYSNGQPMGLYLSFPMFELAHYCILKFATAVCNSSFCICGDDVVVAAENDKDASYIYRRYENLIERFGGLVSTSKTMQSSRFAEGVGAIFLKDIPKEIRIPSGKLSPLEAFTPGTLLYKKIACLDSVGRSILFSWLSTKEYKRYTYEQRTMANEFLINNDLSNWSIDALRSLDKDEHTPQTWPSWEVGPTGLWRLTPSDQENTPIRWVKLSRVRSALITNKIISLYKSNKGTNHDRKA